MYLISHFLTKIGQCSTGAEMAAMHENAGKLDSADIKTLLFLAFIYGSYFLLWWLSDGTPDSVIWVRKQIKKLRRRMRGEDPEEEER